MWSKIYNSKAEALRGFRRQGGGKITEEPKLILIIGRQEVCVNRLETSSENAQKVSVQELKLPKPKEPKRFTVVDLWEIRIDRSLTSGENTLGEIECVGVETPEA
jgi:hypothetical protein